MEWLCAGSAVLALLLLASIIVSRGRRYQRLFSEDHFRELAVEIGRLSSAPSHDPEATAGFATSRGIAVAYSCHPAEEICVHHLSVSSTDGILARSASIAMLAFLADTLGIDLDSPHGRQLFEVGSGVVHLQVRAAPASVDLDVGDEHLQQRITRAMVRRDVLIPELMRLSLPPSTDAS